jgi:hypothetical protein
MRNRKSAIRKFDYKTFNKNTKTKGGNLRNLRNRVISTVKGFAHDHSFLKTAINADIQLTNEQQLILNTLDIDNPNEQRLTLDIDDPIIWFEEAISKEFFKYYDYEHFSNIEEIGHGAFGKVCRANWKNSEQYLALKSFFIYNDTYYNYTTIQEIVREVSFFFVSL